MTQKIKPASMLYRVAAVLLALFALAHTYGFRQSDPKWGVDALLASMRSIKFDVQGRMVSYWDLFLAAGFSLGVLYLFAAVLAWQLGRLRQEALVSVRGIAWTFALCFLILTLLSWRYLFILPVVLSALITLCLILAAWFSSRARAATDT